MLVAEREISRWTLHLNSAARCVGTMSNFTREVLRDIFLFNSSDSETDDYEGLELLVSGFMLTAFSIIGIVGNSISLIVLSRPSMRSSVNCVLQALAAFDLGVLVSAILMLGLRTLSRAESSLSFYSTYLFPRILPVVYPMGLIFQTGSIWCTVVVTVERYVAVCHPLKARSLCTHRNAKFFNVVVVIFSVAYNIPRFFEVKLETDFDPESNSSVLIVEQSEFRSHPLYIEIYYVWLYLFFIYFIPFLSLAFLNVLIWKAVQKANHDRRSWSTQQRREMSMAVALLSVVAVFFVCNVLALVVNILEYCKFGLKIQVLIPFCNFLVVVNSSVNFVIYCIFGHRFKRMFLDILLCRTRFKNSNAGRNIGSRRDSAINTSLDNSMCVRTNLTINARGIAVTDVSTNNSAIANYNYPKSPPDRLF